MNKVDVSKYIAGIMKEDHHNILMVIDQMDLGIYTSLAFAIKSGDEQEVKKLYRDFMATVDDIPPETDSIIRTYDAIVAHTDHDTAILRTATELNTTPEMVEKAVEMNVNTDGMFESAFDNSIKTSLMLIKESMTDNSYKNILGGLDKYKTSKVLEKCSIRVSKIISEVMSYSKTELQKQMAAINEKSLHEQDMRNVLLSYKLNEVYTMANKHKPVVTKISFKKD